ncbi:unnamed protein product [Rotaria sordida]|uniref:BED-type domain-containing protein n=1 Tax=Rotaria sordida TaxID=392033 RepID=A0A819NIS4_9BILA|nr:unnamed protein product [Rotaria sordida]
MASNSNDNHHITSRNVSSQFLISTTSNTPPSYTSSTSTFIYDSPQRSARLSSRSPQVTPKLSNQSIIHRVVSGGVTNSRSPKINIRKKSSASSRRNDYLNIASRIMLDDDVNMSNSNDNSIVLYFNLPADQSEDEEVELSNKTNTIVSPTASRPLTRAEVLSYFEQQTDGYKCKLCEKVYKAAKNSDSNLRKHLSSSHQISNVLYKSQINSYSKSISTTISSDRKDELHNAAINCVIEDGLPFDTFGRPGMSKFLSTAVPGYVGPDRKTVRKRIATSYSLYTKKLRALMPKLDFISLTSDLWKSSNQVHFISLTAHTFTHHYEHVSIVLGFRRIIGPHSSTLIENYIQYELDRLGIQPHQIVSITTDNGSNIKKAAATLRFGNPISCMAHNLNLVVHKGLYLWSEPKQDNFPLEITLDLDEWQDIGGDLDYSIDTIEYDESSIDAAADFVSEEEDNVNNDGETNISGTINIETDGDNDDDIDVQFSSLILNDKNSSPIDHYELLKNVFELMKKTRLIVKFMRNHNITNEYIKKYMLSKNNNRKVGGLVLDMVIRWNSSYLLLDRLDKHKDVVHSICAFPNSIIGLTDQQIKRSKELILNEHEWELICCLKNVLEPFFNATEALSGQNYPTMALSFYVFRLLLHYFESTSKDDKITAALKQSLQFWFNIQCKAKLPAGQIEIMMVRSLP